MEMEAQLAINYSADFLSIDVKNDAIEVIMCSSFFDEMDLQDRLKHVMNHLKEEFYEITENYNIIIQCYSSSEMMSILDEPIEEVL